MCGPSQGRSGDRSSRDQYFADSRGIPVRPKVRTKRSSIDVTRLFTSDMGAVLGGGSGSGASGVDLSRSDIERVTIFPKNIRDAARCSPSKRPPLEPR